MKKLSYFFIVCFALFTPLTFVVHGASKEVILEKRTISDPIKTWTIRFNDEVKEGTVKQSNIYIIDEKGRTLQTKLSIVGNGSGVVIKPETPYKEDTLYYLVIRDNLKSKKDIFLSEKTFVPFIYSKKKETNKENTSTINNKDSTSKETPKTDSSSSAKDGPSKLAIAAKKHSHFVEITVTVADDIPIVQAGRDRFTYKGNNQFVLYKAGLKSGDKIKVEGLSLSGKVIETKEVTIP